MWKNPCFWYERKPKATYDTHAWFLDGTFKTVPNIFYQLFAIVGSVIQIHQGKEQIVALPFIDALLESKEEDAYSKVFEVTLAGSQRLGVPVTLPKYTMTDSELAVINAAWRHIGNLRACFFNLRQNVF